MLKAYDGTTIFVSHDRQLISYLADNVWSIDGTTVSAFRGDFSEWTAHKSKKASLIKESQKLFSIPKW